MRLLDLTEYQQSAPLRLSQDELGSLRSLNEGNPGLSLTIMPSKSDKDSYFLTPGAIVGALDTDDFSLSIRPKIGVPQMLSLACYAMRYFRSREREFFDFEQAASLPDTLALALTAAASRAFARGLLQGYRTEEETLYTVRGRIRFEEQARRRFHFPLPVETRYDEFTEDILANRLVKASANQLRTMRLHSTEVRSRLKQVTALLDNVSSIEFTAANVPEIRFDRLNEHYRDVIGLARLILCHSAFESGRGQVRANGFLIDMNQIFQEFVTVALREKLGVSEKVFGERRINSLDDGGKVVLRPDLTWWQSEVCVFVGDAKYKRVIHQQVPNADLYQLLAYITSLNLPGGMLVYAQGEAEVATHRVRYSGKTLEVVALDLSGSLRDVLDQVTVLAGRVMALRNTALEIPRSAGTGQRVV